MTVIPVCDKLIILEKTIFKNLVWISMWLKKMPYQHQECPLKYWFVMSVISIVYFFFVVPNFLVMYEKPDLLLFYSTYFLTSNQLNNK